MGKKEYIEREAVLERLCGDDPSRMEDYYYNAIKDVPAADVAPVVHGEWLYEKDGCWQCSACKQSHFMNISEGYHPICEGCYYCPNCGAKMDGGNR